MDRIKLTLITSLKCYIYALKCLVTVDDRLGQLLYWPCQQCNVGIIQSCSEFDQNCGFMYFFIYKIFGTFSLISFTFDSIDIFLFWLVFCFSVSDSALMICGNFVGTCQKSLAGRATLNGTLSFAISVAAVSYLLSELS